MNKRNGLIVVGPRRTGTTSLFEMYHNRPFKKALPAPTNYFSYLIMVLHLKRYGHYICPDILHARESVNYMTQHCKRFLGYKIIILNREKKSHLKSLKALDARYGRVRNNYVNELRNVDDNKKQLMQRFDVEEVDLINIVKDKDLSALKKIFGNKLELINDPQNASKYFKYNKVRPPRFMFVVYQYIVGIIGIIIKK